MKQHPIKKVESIYDKFEFKKSEFFNNNYDFIRGTEIYKFIGIVKQISKRKSQNGNLYGVIEASDIEGIVEIFMDIKDIYFIEDNFDKNQIFVFNIVIRSDRNSGIRIVCQSVHKLFDYVSKNINSLDLYIMDRSCLRSLKDKLRNIQTGNSNINIFLNSDSNLNVNNLVRVTLNENIKINDSFINNISRIPFLEKILLK